MPNPDAIGLDRSIQRSGSAILDESMCQMTSLGEPGTHHGTILQEIPKYHEQMAGRP